MLIGKLQKIGVIAVCFAILFTMSACRTSPESSLVINKDFEKLIEEAETPDTDKADINDMQKYDAYVASVKDESFGVTVNIDARVDIPKTDKLSVFRVEQQDFSQELVDKIRSELLGETELYSGGVLSVKTKKDIEEEIAWWRNQMKGADVSDEYRDYCRGKIDSLQNEYEGVAAGHNLSAYISDGKLSTYDKMLAKYGDNEYYQWVKTVNPKGNFVYEISDGSDGNYSMFYVQNNPEKSNKLVFRTNEVYYEDHGGVWVEQTALVPDKKWGSYPENFLSSAEHFEEPVLTELPCEVEKTSLESAVATADGFLEKVGIDGFAYYEGGLFTEEIRIDGVDGTYYGTYYILRYYRNIDGAFITQSSGTKIDPGEGYGEAKLSWAGECIEFRINDGGIVGFDYNAPLKIIETVVENAALKSFEEVKETFEKMMPVTKASTYTEKIFDVDRVRLSYSRISEENSFDTGLIVPVWDFIGYCDDITEEVFHSHGYGSVLAINAIDGSIIDPDLGY